MARRNVRNAYAPTVNSFFDEMSINLNMFSSILWNWVVRNNNSSFIITKKLQWYLTFLMKIRQNFLEPNFLTYSQTHSLVSGLSTAPGHNTLLLIPPSYKIAPIKSTITGGRLSVNNRSCSVQVSICLNSLLYVLNINPLPSVVFKYLRIVLIASMCSSCWTTSQHTCLGKQIKGVFSLRHGDAFFSVITFHSKEIFQISNLWFPIHHPCSALVDWFLLDHLQTKQCHPHKLSEL